MRGLCVFCFYSLDCVTFYGHLKGESQDKIIFGYVMDTPEKVVIGVGHIRMGHSFLYGLLQYHCVRLVGLL